MVRVLYNEFFYIPKDGKIREKVMLARAVGTLVVILLCLAAMGSSAYAYFAHDIASASNTIKAASFDVDIAITVVDSDEIPPEISKNEQKKPVVTLLPNKTYEVRLTREGTASTGFCVLSATDCAVEKYYTQQIGADVNATKSGRDTVVFYLEVENRTEVTFDSYWGTSVYYNPDHRNEETEGIYICHGETVVLPIAGPVVPEEEPEVDIDELEALQRKYQFSYYANIQDAMTEINGDTVGINQTAAKADASVGVYTDELNNVIMVLLKDTTVDAALVPMKNVAINLGGKILTAADTKVLDTLEESPVSIVIDGRMEGSKIQILREDGETVGILRIANGSSAMVLGGTYTSKTNAGEASAFLVGNGGKLMAYGAVIAVESVANAETAQSSDETNEEISDSAATEIVVVHQSYGIVNCGEILMFDCEVKAFANCTADGNDFAIGIDNRENATLRLNNCQVLGTYSGVKNCGSLMVNGGTYQGFGYGGFYLSGANTAVHMKNVISQECPMPEGFVTDIEIPNGAGLFVEDGAGMDNNMVYMDSCEIYGTINAIVLNGSVEEKNNSLYISNSKIGSEGTIRIEGVSHKLYIGIGNDFTSVNTVPEASAIETEEDYSAMAAPDIIAVITLEEELVELAQRYQTTVERIAAYNEPLVFSDEQTQLEIKIPPVDWVVPEEAKEQADDPQTEPTDAPTEPMETPTEATAAQTEPTVEPSETVQP